MLTKDNYAKKPETIFEANKRIIVKTREETHTAITHSLDSSPLLTTTCGAFLDECFLVSVCVGGAIVHTLSTTSPTFVNCNKRGTQNNNKSIGDDMPSSNTHGLALLACQKLKLLRRSDIHNLKIHSICET